MYIDNPCKPDCPDRNATCHVTCHKYREYLDKVAEFKEERDKQKQVDREYYAYKIETITKSQRNRHTTSKVLKKPMR